MLASALCLRNLDSDFIKQKITPPPKVSKLKKLKQGGKTQMKADLNRRELHLLKLWWLSCEDMMIPEGTCAACEFKDECLVIRTKLYGKNGGSRSRQPGADVRAPEVSEQVLPQPA